MTKKNRIWVTTMDPIRILLVYNEDTYEEIIEEWQSTYLKKQYKRVEKYAGSRDKGRDIVCTGNDDAVTIFQCKHYNRELNITDAIIEIGKCCYYCFKDEYNISNKMPKKYFFVSPTGVNATLKDLLKSPQQLKEKLKQKWSTCCESKISSQKIKLEGAFSEFIELVDFSIFDYVSPLEFLKEFKKTPYYTKRFGQLLKPRKPIISVPEAIKENELTYIKKILDAYSEYLKINVSDAKKLQEINPELKKRFEQQRLYFYSAEYLAAYSRDTYDPKEQYFEKLKNEMYHGIIEYITEDAQNGFIRLNSVLKRAAEINFSQDNMLASSVEIQDKKGLCHHLANEREDVKWTK